MKFREHRGGLKESLETIRDFNTMEELESILHELEVYPPYTIKPYCYDARCDQNLWIITGSYYDHKHVAGFIYDLSSRFIKYMKIYGYLMRLMQLTVEVEK